MTIKRAALLAAFIVLGVALLGVALAAWLLATPGGLRFVWNRAANLMPGVEVQALDGRLIGPLVVEGLALTTDGMRVTLERAELRWNPLALLGRSFNAESLSLRGLDVVLIPAADTGAGPSEPFRLPDRIDLPVDINVENLSLEDARVYAEPGAEPLVIDRASLSAHLNGDQWVVHEIVVRAPLLDVDGRVATSPRGRYPSEAELDWNLRPPDLPPAAGTTVVSGDRLELLVSQNVASPYALEATVAITDPFSQPALDGELDFWVEPAELGFDVPVASVSASVSAEGPLDDLALSGRAELPAPDLADLRLEFDGSYSGGALLLESLRIADAGSPAEVSLSGRVALAPDIDVALEGDWSSLQWPLRGEPLFTSDSGMLRLSGGPQDLTAALDASMLGGGIDGTLRRAGQRIAADLAWRNVAWPESGPEVTSDDGSVRVEGRLDDYRLTIDAGLALADGPGGHVRLDGAGTREGLEFEQVDIAALDGTLTGRGSVAWAPALVAELDVAARGLDPGAVSPDWRGRLDGNVVGGVALEGGDLSVELRRLSVSGELRERTIRLDARGGFEAAAARVETFTLRSGETTVGASGTIGPRLDLEWRLQSPDLADLWPDVAGRLDASGRASGPRLRPIVAIDADGADLDVFGVAVDALHIAADVDVAGERRSELDVGVDGLRYAERALERLRMSGGGDANAHALSLSAAGEGADAGVELRGRLERAWQPDYAWSFTLEEATLAYAELAPWNLRAPASGRVTRAGTELAETCLQSGAASLCAEAASQQGATRAAFALTELPFQYFASFFPEGARITGTIAAEGEVALSASEPPRIDVQMTTSRGRFGSEAIGGGVAGFTFGRGMGRFAWDGGVMDVSVDWPFERDQGRLELGASIVQEPDEPFTASAVEGSLFIELRDLSFLPDLVAGAADTAGMVAGDIDVTGTVAEPRIAGRLELTDGTARLRRPDITLEDLRVALTGDGRGGIAVDAQGRSGGGVFEADGRLDLEGAVPVGYIEVEGEDFQLIGTPDATVYVTPDLRLGLEPRRLELTGEVSVPRASITPRGTTEGAVQPSPDQVFVDAEAEQAVAAKRPLYATVDIMLGDDVTFEGFGLTGRLAGALEVVEVPAEPTTGSGELRVENGTYAAYGQELEIRRGRLVFAGGALTRPGIDVEAVRRPAEGVLVGARVQGTLRQPELSVFSEPPMARQEQLSYLVLGRPLENASASETSALSQAAMALGLRGGNFVSERVNEMLGFDEFGIQTQPGEDANSASFVIGKYLSPSLYVSYGVGLFEPVNTLRLRYTISSNWRLVTESSSKGSGGDLIYHIERD